MSSGQSVKSQLLGLVGVAVFALLVVAGVGYTGLKKGGEMIDEVAAVRMPSILALEMVSQGQTAIRAENRRAGLAFARPEKADDLKKVLEAKQGNWKHIDKGWKIYEPLPQTPEEAKLWTQFAKDWESWKAADQKISDLIGKLASADSPESRQALKADFFAALDAAVPLFDKAEAGLDQIVELNVKIGEEAAKEGHDSAGKSVFLSLVSSVIALAVLSVLGWRVVSNIVSTLGGEPAQAQQVVERIAGGDLTQNLNVAPGDRDSLMARQQAMQENLRAMVQRIRTSVDQTEHAASSLAGAAQQVASASNDTSESASTMAASVEEMSVSINHVSDNAQEALNIARKTGALSADGGQVIAQSVKEINHIATTVRATAENIRSLTESSSRISSVVQVIKDVADQTNLLALNAAIEAARAGETGRGFAVVADEVRKLAERTAMATGEISQMIDKIQHDTQASVGNMEVTVTQVDRGVALANQAGEAIGQIEASVQSVVAVVNDIVNAIREQGMASQEIAKRVEQVAQASEENNAAAQETSGQARTLSGLAGDLKAAISGFRT